MENEVKHRVIKLVTTERRRNYLESEPNYHIAKSFSENLLAISNRCDYVKSKYCEKSKTVLYGYMVSLYT